MQMLDTKSIVALALCSRRLFADANDTFAFKYAALLPIFQHESTYANSLLRFHMNRMITCMTTSDAFAHFETYRTRITHLQFLQLEIQPNDDDSLYERRISDALVDNQTLKCVRITYPVATEAFAIHVAHALGTNTKLQTLILSSTQVDETGLVALCAAVANNCTLTSLRLTYAGITTYGVRHVADMLRINNTLTSLYIDGHYYGDEGIVHIAKALQTNTVLISLDISDNEITDTGIKHLAHALTLNNTLQCMSLRDNIISDDGFLSLANACTMNSSMRAFDMQWLNITREAIVPFLDICKSFKRNDVQFNICNNRRIAKSSEPLKNLMNTCKHLIY